MPRFSIAAAAANMAQYLSQNQGGQMKSNHGALVDRTHLYWPGLQGLVANPMAWRDRLGSSEFFFFFVISFLFTPQTQFQITQKSFQTPTSLIQINFL
jgi:hypothetical protein